MSLAKADGFEVVVNTDQAFQIQQSAAQFPWPTIILHPAFNEIDNKLALVPKRS